MVNPRPMATSVRVSRPVVWVVAVVFRSASGQSPCHHPAAAHIYPVASLADTPAAVLPSASDLVPCHRPGAVGVGYR